MWTNEHRKTYRRECSHFLSDLTDAEWVRLEPLIPAAEPGERPRKTLTARLAVESEAYGRRRKGIVNFLSAGSSGSHADGCFCDLVTVVGMRGQPALQQNLRTCDFA
jgi:transposase